MTLGRFTRKETKGRKNKKNVNQRKRNALNDTFLNVSQFLVSDAYHIKKNYHCHTTTPTNNFRDDRKT